METLLVVAVSLITLAIIVQRECLLQCISWAEVSPRM